MRNFVVIFALCMAFVSCSEDDNDNNVDERYSIELSAEEKSVSAELEDFAYSSFRQLCDGSNVVFSPLSSQMALSMTLNAAGDNVQDEILENLCPGNRLSTLNLLNGKLYAGLPKLDRKSAVCMANSMWVDRDKSACAGLRSVLSEYYGAGIYNYDSRERDAAAEKINRWVSEMTRGELGHVADPDLIGSATLVNAVYFKGEWADKFDRENTKKDFFTNADGTRSQVMFMNGRHNGAYGERGGTKYGMAYFGNGSYFITFVMPGDNKSITEGLDDYRQIRFAATYEESLKPCVLNVKVPRFTGESRHDLKSVYGKMGLGALSDGGLPGLVDGETIMVKSIVQQCKFVMDEDGAAASGSTVVSGDPTAPEPKPEYTLVLDRPFAYMITEMSTGTIMFMGCVSTL